MVVPAFQVGLKKFNICLKNDGILYSIYLMHRMGCHYLQRNESYEMIYGIDAPVARSRAIRDFRFPEYPEFCPLCLGQYGNHLGVSQQRFVDMLLNMTPIGVYNEYIGPKLGIQLNVPNLSMEDAMSAFLVWRLHRKGCSQIPNKIYDEPRNFGYFYAINDAYDFYVSVCDKAMSKTDYDGFHIELCDCLR